MEPLWRKGHGAAWREGLEPLWRKGMERGGRVMEPWTRFRGAWSRLEEGSHGADRKSHGGAWREGSWSRLEGRVMERLGGKVLCGIGSSCASVGESLRLKFMSLDFGCEWL